MASEVSGNPTRRYHRVGNYQVLSHIATGGMGVVYRALDTETGQEVALKILSPTLATQPIALERFRREARQGAKLRHENLVAIYGLAEENNLYFLVLEYVEGIDLHEYISQKGRLEPAEAITFLTQAVQALEYLHQRHFVHRDIKPANFLVTRVGDELVLKLTDLGLAREVSDQEFRVTRAGNTVGSIDYMAPEQARDSGAADIRSDIYSLGCTLYHMLAGRPPFAEGGLTERLYRHAEEEPPDIRQFNARVSSELARILRRMLAKKREDRYQTPADLLDDLGRLNGEHPESQEFHVEEEQPSHSDGEQTDESKQILAGWHNAVTEFSLKAYPAEAARTPVPATIQGPSTKHRTDKQAAGVSVSEFQKAQQALRQGNLETAIASLLRCCTLDPSNLNYRQTLRKLLTKKAQAFGGSPWMRWIRHLLTRAKFRAVQRTGDDIKLLEFGETILVRNPDDMAVHVAMAEAAERLGLKHVSLWMLEYAWQKQPQDAALSRALATIYEKRGSFKMAGALWKLVLRANPYDMEARKKANDVAVQEAIARGRYQEIIDTHSDSTTS